MSSEKTRTTARARLAKEMAQTGLLYVNRKYLSQLSERPDLRRLLKKGVVKRVRENGGGGRTNYTVIISGSPDFLKRVQEQKEKLYANPGTDSQRAGATRSGSSRNSHGRHRPGEREDRPAGSAE